METPLARPWSPFLPSRIRLSLRLVLAQLLLSLSFWTASCTGPLPNLATRTAGGTQLWADVAWRQGWRVQQHAWTGHARILDEGDVRRGWGSLEACRDLLPPSDTQAAPKTVVLLHGLWGTRRRMGPLKQAFEAAGYSVVDVGYPSTTGSVAEHAARVEALLSALDGEGRELSFVTFSLGGLVLRRLFLDAQAPWRKRHRACRAVMVAAPHAGARLAQLGLQIPGAGLLYGEPARELAAGRLAELPILDIPFLTIAGRRRGGGWNPWIPGDDDGVVSVDEARLEGAEAHLIVEGAHPFLMGQGTVIEASVNFVQFGHW